MSQDKLRPFMKAVADLPADRLGLFLDLVKKCSGDNTDPKVLSELQKFNKGKPCWIENATGLVPRNYHQIIVPSYKDLLLFPFLDFLEKDHPGNEVLGFHSRDMTGQSDWARSYALKAPRIGRFWVEQRPEPFADLEKLIVKKHGFASRHYLRAVIVTLIDLQSRGLKGLLADDGSKNRFFLHDRDEVLFVSIVVRMTAGGWRWHAENPQDVDAGETIFTQGWDRA
jgi:hypothetical protein